MTKFSLTIKSLGLLQCYPAVRLNVSVTWEGTSLHILQNAAKHSGKVLYKNKIKKKKKQEKDFNYFITFPLVLVQRVGRGVNY